MIKIYTCSLGLMFMLAESCADRLKLCRTSINQLMVAIDERVACVAWRVRMEQGISKIKRIKQKYMKLLCVYGWASHFLRDCGTKKNKLNMSLIGTLLHPMDLGHMRPGFSIFYGILGGGYMDKLQPA